MGINAGIIYGLYKGLDGIPGSSQFRGLTWLSRPWPDPGSCLYRHVHCTIKCVRMVLHTAPATAAMHGLRTPTLHTTQGTEAGQT